MYIVYISYIYELKSERRKIFFWGGCSQFLTTWILYYEFLKIQVEFSIFFITIIMYCFWKKQCCWLLLNASTKVLIILEIKKRGGKR